MKKVVTDTSSVYKLLDFTDQKTFPVVKKDTDEYIGYISRDAIGDAHRDLTCGQFLAQSDVQGVTRHVYIKPDEPALEAAKKLATFDVDVLPIVENGKYDGIVDYKSLMLIMDEED